MTKYFSKTIFILIFIFIFVNHITFAATRSTGSRSSRSRPSTSSSKSTSSSVATKSASTAKPSTSGSSTSNSSSKSSWFKPSTSGYSTKSYNNREYSYGGYTRPSVSNNYYYDSSSGWNNFWSHYWFYRAVTPEHRTYVVEDQKVYAPAYTGAKSIVWDLISSIIILSIIGYIVWRIIRRRRSRLY